MQVAERAEDRIADLGLRGGQLVGVAFCLLALGSGGLQLIGQLAAQTLVVGRRQLAIGVVALNAVKALGGSLFLGEGLVKSGLSFGVSVLERVC